MATNKSIVYLGYDDEEISINYAGNSTVNKLGGSPDWPPGVDIKIPSCQQCNTQRPLIVQLYTPLEHSQFHRTLYIFACLNPMCSQNTNNWLCVRTQHLDYQTAENIVAAAASLPTLKSKKKKNSKQSKAIAQNISWCKNSDDWGDDEETIEEMDTAADEYNSQNEENGNVITQNVNTQGCSGFGQEYVSLDDELTEFAINDDDDDDSNSMENDLICGLGQLDMHSLQNAEDDPNANCAAGDAAAGDNSLSCVLSGATATIAEIEGSETDVVLVETPQKPERDLIALLKHTNATAAFGPLSKLTNLTLRPYFIAVEIEPKQQKSDNEHYTGDLSAAHIRELYQEYKLKDEMAGAGVCGGGSGEGALNKCVEKMGGDESELYEKSLPAHGDLIFHHFISTIQKNPGQILRYSRDTLPTLIAPLSESVPKCPNCNGETICEVQILPTLIPKLYLQQNNELAPIEYGNVLIFTCLKSCWDTPDKMRYERVIVQAEK